MHTLDDIIAERIPLGWSWSLYSECGDLYKARAVLVSPDHRIHIGREGKSIDEALRNAARDARSGAKE